jgi:hypothetical protein
MHLHACEHEGLYVGDGDAWMTIGSELRDRMDRVSDGGTVLCRRFVQSLTPTGKVENVEKSPCERMLR